MNDEIYQAFIVDSDGNAQLRTTTAVEGVGALPSYTLNDLWYNCVTVDGDGNKAIRVIYV